MRSTLAAEIAHIRLPSSATTLKENFISKSKSASVSKLSASMSLAWAHDV